VFARFTLYLITEESLCVCVLIWFIQLAVYKLYTCFDKQIIIIKLILPYHYNKIQVRLLDYLHIQTDDGFTPSSKLSDFSV
jgi:hypothetical protein